MHYLNRKQKERIFFLTPFMYIYIYIYIYRERERERDFDELLAHTGQILYNSTQFRRLMGD